MLNLASICKQLPSIAREIFSIINCTDYKLKQTIIQFIVDLAWKLGGSMSQPIPTVVIDSLANLIQVI